MHNFRFQKLIGLLVCILLLANSFPVRAQDIDPSMTPTEQGYSTTIDPLPNMLTETPMEPSTDTPTETNTTEPTPTATPTLEPSPSPILTLSPTSSPRLPRQSNCDTDGVYRYEIILGYKVPNFPDISANYSIVDSFPETDGIQITTLQLNPQDFCWVLLNLQQNLDVEFAEPNYSVSLLDTYPNDPELPKQYYLNNILAPQGWDYTTGSVAVTIAVIDTGIDLTHVDLASKLMPGYDFLENDTYPQDPNGHGTLVAGIAAAITNNGIGVAGVSWGAQIMPLRVLDAAGNGTNDNVAQAIIWATQHGARVINMSFGGTQQSEAVATAIEYALEQGVVLVAATGNQGASSVLYPAAYNGVVGVGATDSTNQLAYFSNTGEDVDVVAPGVSIYSTYPGNRYNYSSGTSMSAPMVSGFAALLASLPGMYYSSRIVDEIESTALDLGAPGWDPQYGYGLVQIGPAAISVLNQYGESTPTSTPVTPVPNPTATQVVIFEPPQSYQSPTPVPTIIDLNGFTATPGDVSIQQAASPSATFQMMPSATATYQNGSPTGLNPNAPSGKMVWLFMLPFGMLCIMVGIGLFIYLRRKYKM